MTNPLILHFQILARYNTLTNRRLYDTCGQLDDAERKRIRPALFKSIYGTLNHILVGSRIWLTRFEGGEVGSTGLDAILYDDFNELVEARVLEDARIETFVFDLHEEFLRKTIRYQNNQGNIHIDPVELLLAHFFNHQAHHRVQVHDMLTQTDVAPPSLDMHRIIRPNPTENLTTVDVREPRQKNIPAL